MSWRRILLLSIALVSVLAVATWALLQNSDVATEFVRREVQNVFATRAEVASTAIGLEAGRLQIEGFELADPTQPERALVRIAKGRLDAQLDPFGAGIAPRHVVVEGLEIEAGPTFPTAAQLLKPREASTDGGVDLDLPVVEVRSGKATLHLCEDERPLVLDGLDVTVVPHHTDRRKLQITGSLALTEPAAALQLRGEVDLESGAARLSISTEAVTCSQQVVAYLARLAQVDQQALDVGGEIESLRVTCLIPPHTAAVRTPTFEVEARCSDVHVNAPDLPAIVRHADVQLLVSTAQGGVVQATISQHNETGAIDVRARITELDASGDDLPKLELDAKGRDVVVDGNVLAALRTFPIGKRVVEALRPTAGRADIDLYLHNPHIPGGDAEIDLQLRDVAMSFHGFGDGEQRIGFPMPLEHASGRVRLRNDILLLRDMKASIPASAGGGEVTLRGRIEVRRGRGDDTSLDIEGTGVAFRDDLRTALATLLRDDGELYDRLAPEGRADVHVVVRPRSELAGGFGVEVTPQGASMRWAGFPYELKDLRGSIRVRMADARFDLTGRHGDGGLTMRGRIPLDKQHGPEDGFEAVIDLDQLAVDDDLRQGVAVVVRELDAQWQKAMPSGRLSGKVKVWRPLHDDPLFHDVRLQLDDVDLDLPLAPWRATGLRGQVLVQGSGPTARIDFDALRGSLTNGVAEPARLALLGHLESGPDVVRDLAFVVRDLELCEQLGKSLDDLGALGFETWDSLQPSGRVDLVVRERLQPESDPDLQVVVQLVDVRSDARMLPKPAEHMTGELHIEGGELTFRDVRGELGGATVRCYNGRVRQVGADDDRTEIAFDVHAKDFPVDDGLANLFTGPLRKAVLDRHLRGKADVDGLRLRFRVPGPDSGKPFTTTIGGAIGLDGVDMQLGTGRDGIRVLNLHGMVSLADSTVTETGGQLVGTLSRGSLSLFGHPFEAVETTFTADARKLTIHTLKTRIHDGELRHAKTDAPALSYLLPAANVPEGRLSADLQFDRVDVFTLLSTSGWRNPPYTGLASGRMTLSRLDGNNVVGAEAAGTLQIERADLGKVPLFTAIYAQLPPANQPRFNQLDMTFRLTDHLMSFDRLEVRSEILAAKGSGKLNLDGYLDVEMELDNLLGQSADPLVMPLIDYLAKNLVSFRLYGHLRDLHASTEFLGSRTPDRPPVLPMPPKRPKSSSPGY
ncbi:MAG: hypothetical protein ACE37K_08380 [Planctomycetota bacterium]